MVKQEPPLVSARILVALLRQNITIMLILQTRGLNTLRNAGTVTELHDTVFNAVPDTFQVLLRKI